MRFITARPFAFLSAAVVALALVAAACSGNSGSGDQERGPVLTPVTTRYLPQTVSSDVAVGPNRFLVGLIDQETNLVVIGAQLHFRFFQLEGDQATLEAETDATPIQVTRSYTHTHADSTVESHEAGEVGLYVANVEFDSAGTWAVEVSGSVDSQPIDPVTPIFTVREESLTPALGEPAPRSLQTLLRDVADITELDTSDPPNPDMHDMTIADAVTSGQPTVIVFATPAFCLSQICGPTKQIVDDLYTKYKDQANFVHVEPYFLDLARQGTGLCAVPVFNLRAAREQWGGPDCPVLTDDGLPPPDESWNLETEPWVFLVDKDGNIAAKFEAIVTFDELEAALIPLLASAARP